MPLGEIKGFNALIDDKPLFDQSGKSKQKAYEKLVEMSSNSDLDHELCYKVICIDLSRQTNMSIPQQTNFIEKLIKDNCAKKNLSLKNSKKLF